MSTNTGGGTTTSLNNTPQAVDDFYTAGEDQILYFSVMANDLGGNAKTLWSIDNTSDDGSSDLVAKDVAGVCEYSELGAKISLTSDGRIRYDTTMLNSLAAGETVTDQFTYAIRMSNGTLSWATVTVTLSGTNDGPVAVDDIGSGNEDTTITGSVATNDSDVDNGAVLTYGPVGSPPAGFTLNPDGTWSLDASNAAYQHLAAGATTQVIVNYTVTDEHGASDTGTLTITVTGTNDGPVAHADTAGTTENASLTVNVLANDTDADDGHVLTVTAASAPAGQGSASVVSNQVQFDPGTDFDHLAEGATASVTVSYTITDEHCATSSSTVTITVTGTNDGPVANADTDGTTENASILVDVLANDTDADDGHVLTVTAASAPAGQGSASVVANQVQFDPGTDFDHLAEGATASVTVNYTIQDEHGASSSASLTITVTGTNDVPVAVADEAAVDEDSSIFGNVGDNDSDADAGASLGYALDDPAPAGLVFNADGSWTFDASSYDSLDDGEELVLTIPYTVTDEHGAADGATLTITVTGTNDVPVAVADEAAVDEDSSIFGNVGDNDSDADAGASLGYALDDPAPAGLTFNPDGSWTFDASSYDSLDDGEELVLTIPYTVTDDHGASDGATLTITVTGTNDVPVAVADTNSATEGGSAVTGSVATNDSDPDDGASLGYALDAPVAGLTLDPDGSYSFDPADPAYDHLPAGVPYDVVASYTVTDEHGASDTATLTITVTGVNDAALFSGLDYQYVGENDLVNTVGGDLDSTDVDGVDDAFIAVVGPALSDKGWGTFTIDASGNWTYALDNSNPEVDALGLEDASDSFTVYAADGTAKVINIYIAGNNDAAVISGTTSGSVTEAGSSNGGGTPSVGGTLTDTDVDNPANSFTEVVVPAVSANGYGTFTMTAGGTWTYTVDNSNPAVNALNNGGTLPDSFVVTSIDGTQQTILITINGADDVIVVTPPATYTGTGDPNDFDSLTGGPANNAATITGTTGGDTITGGGASQAINTLGGNDTAYGGGGDDIIHGGDGNDNLYGQAGNDQIFGESGNDALYGGTGNDQLSGGDNNDLDLYGGSGDDIISGGDNTDRLYGGYGADTLTGGAGNDTFFFLDLKDTNDVITDYLTGADKLDFTALDANSALGGNQIFGWGGDTATANSLWMVESGGNTVIYGDTDGNVATAEFMVTLQGFTDFDPLVQPPSIIF